MQFVVQVRRQLSTVSVIREKNIPFKIQVFLRSFNKHSSLQVKGTFYMRRCGCTCSLKCKRRYLSFPWINLGISLTLLLIRAPSVGRRQFKTKI